MAKTIKAKTIEVAASHVAMLARPQETARIWFWRQPLELATVRPQGVKVVAESASPLRVIEEMPAYWRVVFDYPPFNIVDATIIPRPPGLARAHGRRARACVS